MTRLLSFLAPPAKAPRVGRICSCGVYMDIRWLAVAAFGLLAACATPEETRTASQPIGAATATSAPTTTAEVAPEEAGADPDEMICEYQKVKGSIIRRRVCMTRAERQLRRDDSQDASREIQNQSLRSCAAGSSCGI